VLKRDGQSIQLPSRAHWHGEADPWRGNEGDGKGDRQSLLLPQLRARRSQCKQTHCWQNKKRIEEEMAQRLGDAR